MNFPADATARAHASARLSAGVARETQRFLHWRRAMAALWCGTESIVKQPTDFVIPRHGL
jgi:uncharacterized protein YfaQ (DUF2300 family)